MHLEGLGKLKKEFYGLIGTRTNDLEACSIAPHRILNSSLESAVSNDLLHIPYSSLDCRWLTERVMFKQNDIHKLRAYMSLRRY